MPKRTFLPRFRGVVGSAILDLLIKVQVWVLNRRRLGRIEGIAICDLQVGDANSGGFLEKTQQAMDLIKLNDPRRYRRVCRYLKFIVNTRMVETGRFLWQTGACEVDHAQFAEAHPASYAQLLVHEATHGLLFAKGIPYSEKMRERVERLCHLEQQRFALHLGPDFKVELMPAFDLESYQLYWEQKQR